MAPEYWLKQETGKPAFSELLWSRPQNKQFAGKLAVIGGNLHGFAAPGEAYGVSLKTGVGVARVLLPDAVKKLVGPILEDVEFAASNPSGSFNQQALAEWLSLANWADGVLLAGDLGRNSETAIVLEKFIGKYPGSLTITKDAADYAISIAPSILNRADTTLVISMAQLRKLFMVASSTQAIRLSMGLLQLVEALHTFTEGRPVAIVTKHHDILYTAYEGRVSTTQLTADIPVWRVKAAAIASVWQLQNPGKTFEALTTAVAEIANTIM
jgi:ADP-dependent NAD(P)H-hydrate dehydratase / NAD(P)H-hydrate epimerase